MWQDPIPAKNRQSSCPSTHIGVCCQLFKRTCQVYFGTAQLTAAKEVHLALFVLLARPANLYRLNCHQQNCCCLADCCWQCHCCLHRQRPEGCCRRRCGCCWYYYCWHCCCCCAVLHHHGCCCDVFAPSPHVLCTTVQRGAAASATLTALVSWRNNNSVKRREKPCIVADNATVPRCQCASGKASHRFAV